MKKLIPIVVLLWVAPQLFSQYPYQFFYGKNKIIKSRFHWRYSETDHFKVYFYTSDRLSISTVAAEAEKAYTKIAQFLNMDIEGKTPIIFFSKQTDIEQTNLIPGILPPGGFEGFTEPVGHRLVIYGNRSPAELSRLILHELSHSFEYEIIYKNVSRSMLDFNPPPLWIMEGFAEFMTDYWDSFYLMTITDGVINDRIPELGKDGDIHTDYYNDRTTPYDFGHLIYDFLNNKFGKSGIRQFLKGLKRAGLMGQRRSALESFGLSHRQFNHDFKKYARERFASLFSKENPEGYSAEIGPEFPYGYAFSHQISPSGELLAVATVNFRGSKIDIVLISTKDGRIIKNITPGFTSKYDAIELKFDPAEGRTLCWDTPGEKIAFFARKELTSYLVILNILDGKVVQKIKLSDEIQKPASPVFHPTKSIIYFTGIENISSALYAMDLSSAQVTKLTSGELYIKAIDIAPDGKQFLYSALWQGSYKLFLAPLDNPEQPLRLTTGVSNDITPAFARDGKQVYFSSDTLGTFNIFSLDLDNKAICRFSDVRTGNFFPIAIPNEEKTLVISSFNKGVFYLYKIDTTRILAKSDNDFSKFSQEEKLALPEEVTPPKQLPVKKYKPWQKLVFEQLPPISLAFSTNGDIFGSTYIYLTDLMGDHNMFVYLYSDFGYRSFFISYLNQQRRAQLYASAFSISYGFYYPYQKDSYVAVRKEAGGECGIIYPFNRSYRAELGVSVFHQMDVRSEGTELPYGNFFTGMVMPITFSLVGETTRFAEYGPNMGHTFRFSVSKYLQLFANAMDAVSFEGDIRKYLRIDNQFLLAFRLDGYYSGGKNPLLYWNGGNNTIRSVNYRSLLGERGFFFNAEFRFPIIQRALTPLGIIGPFRGTIFFDLGGLWFGDDQEYKFFKPGDFPKLKDGLASYGWGVEFFLFSLPLHVEWVYKTDFSEHKYSGINFWIGYDF